METFKEPNPAETYIPTRDESDAIREVLETFEKGRTVLHKAYNYFGGRDLFEVIDDWTKRWNGYTPPLSPLLDQTQSNIFINFTRNAIISYLAKVAMSPVKAHIVAVNKKTGLPDQKFADILEDLNTFSLRAENADQKFLRSAMECAVKGTVVVYEGYMRSKQKMKTPIEYDATTGKIKYKEQDRILFDNCYQEVVPLEDFYIVNPFQPDVQKQPKILWRKITSFDEAKEEFGHYRNWKHVRKGEYSVTADLNTFYRQTLMTELGKDQVEILREYCHAKNFLKILINGVVLYDGPIPFKDGKYPFAKTVNEPFAVDFFWGNGNPNKYMGEQDLINTFINAMADKTINSLLPTGLSSDLDDLIEDDAIEIGKFRKVGDIDKWKWWEAPAVNAGEMNMFQQIMNLAKESGNTDAGSQTTPKGGKMQTRQILLKQQEVMQKLSFNMNFLEDMERDRTELRISHIIQFYSIPKIEKITGKKGKEIEQLAYREVQLSDVKLSDGRKGNRVIKLIDGDSIKNSDDRAKLQDELSVTEMKGEVKGVPTEAFASLHRHVPGFQQHGAGGEVQFLREEPGDRPGIKDGVRQLEIEPADHAGSAAQEPQGLIDFVEEAFDIDTDQFETAAPGQVGQMGQQPNPMQQQGQPQQGGTGKPQVLAQNNPTSAIGQNALNQM